MIRAVVFDFDGVIANTEPLHFRALRDVLAREAVVLTEADYYGRYSGTTTSGRSAQSRPTGACNGTLGRWPASSRASPCGSKSSRVPRRSCSPAQPLPYAAWPSSAPLRIASGAARRDHACFGSGGPGWLLPVVVAAEDAPASKPAPDPYRRAVERMAAITGVALAPSDCVAIEDSKWGLESRASRGSREPWALPTLIQRDALTHAAEAVILHLDQLTWELLGQFDEPQR